jgi:hypothetical protein
MNDARIARAPLAVSSITASARFGRSRRAFSTMKSVVDAGDSLHGVGGRPARDSGEGS